LSARFIGLGENFIERSMHFDIFTRAAQHVDKAIDFCKRFALARSVKREPTGSGKSDPRVNANYR
jgi:hypothetical protein